MNRVLLACVLSLALGACYSTGPIDATVQPWSQGAQPLHYAVYYDDAGTVELLLEHQADVNATAANGWTPLHVACAGGHGDLVDLLIESGANVNAATDLGETPVVLATRRGAMGIVEDLLSRGASVTR